MLVGLLGMKPKELDWPKKKSGVNWKNKSEKSAKPKKLQLEKRRNERLPKKLQQKRLKKRPKRPPEKRRQLHTSGKHSRVMARAQKTPNYVSIKIKRTVMLIMVTELYRGEYITTRGRILVTCRYLHQSIMLLEQN